MNKKNIFIPTEEQLDRASREMEEWNRPIRVIEKEFIEHFSSLCDIHSIWIFAGKTPGSDATVFLKTEKDIEVCKKKKLLPQMTDFLKMRLIAYERYAIEETPVVVRLDSDEKVKKEFNRNYYKRMR